MTISKSDVRVRVEERDIPTYGIGKPDRNPMFLEKRVYQGSSGRVYPYPVIDKILDEKRNKTYQVAVLENEYLHIEIMPELGGRIYRALDKTNNYDFVYYNRVIKPALVGLAGPWISGGIEFNWPQHHRPNTFGPVEWNFKENEDGSATLWVSEIDRMYGTKVTTGFTLYPGKAYLEIHAQLYNRTPFPQTFLWWANPAVSVNDHTQSVFPPDVTAVFDHGKRDVSRFPIATGIYYKMDYAEGVDISRYKNIPVPTSYMAYKSDYDFIGGYDHGVQAGLLHVANHHISPGKKQWTWGCGDFGQAWDRHLTDEDGPYIELMTGVFTDNQPDFSWLMPYEEKSFKQYFMPYKHIGVVKNASLDAAVNLEVDEKSRTAVVQAYASSEFADASIELRGQSRVYLNEKAVLSPTSTFKTEVALDAEDAPHDLKVTVRDASGRVLVSYRPAKPAIERVPDPAEPLPAPEELKTNEQLYLAGLHLEQYRHATFEPEDYYLEGLKRDASDIRLNVAYGTLLMRRGLFAESERYFRRATRSLTWRNPNPYDSEAYYQLGMSLQLQGRLEEAYAAFYKSVWSAAWQDSGYFALAQIACTQGAYAQALELVECSLNRNVRHYRARHLKAALLRKLGRFAEAEAFAQETLRLDAADFGAYNELALTLASRGEQPLADQMLADLRRLMRGSEHNYLNLAADYAFCGLLEEGIGALERLVSVDDASSAGEPPATGAQQPNLMPMVHYALAYLYGQAGRSEQAAKHRQLGRQASPDYCFPNSLFDYLVLQSTIATDESDDRAHYYFGNWLYDKKRYDDAIRHWEASRALNDAFPIVHRNLALAYYNKRNDPQAALVSLERAFALQPDDARVFYELDQLYKKVGTAPAERYSRLERNFRLVQERDDLYAEYVTLLNTLGRHEEAIAAMNARKFHPWEGGEGKITAQHLFAHVELAKQALRENRYADAIDLLQRALVYPENLGEGKLAGAQDNQIHYYLGCACEGLHQHDKAAEHFRLASQGLEEPANAMYYNDQPPDTIFYQGLAWRKLGNEKEARRRFNKLVDYGEKHLFDDVKFDFFAVSLPDFLVFDDDLNKRNRIHCHYMMGLGHLGLGLQQKARAMFKEALHLDPSHQSAAVHLRMCR
jgi:tetratricopeptide (TPR) repeat protein